MTDAQSAELNRLLMLWDHKRTFLQCCRESILDVGMELHVPRIRKLVFPHYYYSHYPYFN